MRSMVDESEMKERWSKDVSFLTTFIHKCKLNRVSVRKEWDTLLFTELDTLFESDGLKDSNFKDFIK